MGLFTYLFGRKKEYSEPSLSLEQATEIVWSYGDVLENSTPATGTFADASRLPHPKPVIKQALIVMLRSNDNPRIKAYLKSAYLALANWQDGAESSGRGHALKRMNTASGSRKRTIQPLTQVQDFEKSLARVKAEGQQLRSELQILDLW